MGNKRRIMLDSAKIQALAASDWTLKEIALEMGCSHDTLERFYKEDIKKGKAKGTGQLKLKAHKEALDGNARILELLLKQRCGYSEKQKIEVSGQTEPNRIVVEFVDSTADKED